MTRRIAGHWIVHVVLPLAVGAAIYVLWRRGGFVYHQWLDGIGLGGLIRSLHRADGLPGPTGIVLFSLPDGLWAYSTTMFFGLVWLEDPGKARWLWPLGAAVVTLGAELAQLHPSVPGTFSWVDLAFMVGAVLLAGFVLWPVNLGR